MDYLKNFFLDIYGIELLFILAFFGTLTLLFELKNKITKKEGWDSISIVILIIVSAIFIGIYFNYEDTYKQYKAEQKEQREETTKNWTKEDWKNYEAQQGDQDYQCVHGGCQ